MSSKQPKGLCHDVEPSCTKEPDCTAISHFGDCKSMGRTAESESKTMPLSGLLISPQGANFYKQASGLIAEADEDRLGRWYVRMNQHEWPDDEDDPIPLHLAQDWSSKQRTNAQAFVFALITQRLDEPTQTLYWRAAGHGSRAVRRRALAELEYLKQQRQRWQALGTRQSWGTEKHPSRRKRPIAR